MEHVDVRIAGERRPTEKVPGVVKGRPWERQHRRFWDPVQPEILPGLLTSSRLCRATTGWTTTPERDKIARQLGRVAPNATGRRRQELLYVECDSQGCSSVELRSSR